jgi:hypothetical protein
LHFERTPLFKLDIRFGRSTQRQAGTAQTQREELQRRACLALRGKSSSMPTLAW